MESGLIVNINQRKKPTNTKPVNKMNNEEISIFENNPSTDWVVHIKSRGLYIDFPSKEDAEKFLILIIRSDMRDLPSDY